MKKYKCMIGIIILCVVLVVIFNVNDDTVLVNTIDEEEFRNEYEELNGEMSTDGREYPSVEVGSNNKIKYIDIDEVLDMLKDGNGVIYIGYAECIYCRSAVQVLVDTARDMELENIYYLDIDDVWDIKEVNDVGEVVISKRANDRYDELLEELGEELIINYVISDNKGEKIDTNSKRVNVPLVIFVVNGEIVSYNVGTLFSQKDPYRKLNVDQVKGLSEIYSYGIRDVLGTNE